MKTIKYLVAVLSLSCTVNAITIPEGRKEIDAFDLASEDIYPEDDDYSSSNLTLGLGLGFSF